MLDLDRIDAYCAAATEGPWEWDVNTYDAVWGPDGDQICKCWGNLALGTEADDDAQFIANARTDLPALVAELKQAREQIAEAKAALEWAARGCQFRGSDLYDTCEDNCRHSYRGQEECPIWTMLMELDIARHEATP